MLNEYLVLKNLVDKDICDRLSVRILEKEFQNLYHFDSQCLTSPAFDGLLDDLAEFSRLKISKAIDQDLINTYNYCRVYKPDEILQPHKDKNQCEVAVSITLSTKNQNIWPIWIYSDQKRESMEIKLDIGDALIYKGFELLHWRNKFNEKKDQIQAFLFYTTDDRFQDPFFPGIEKLIKRDYEWLL